MRTRTRRRTRSPAEQGIRNPDRSPKACRNGSVAAKAHAAPASVSGSSSSSLRSMGHENRAWRSLRDILVLGGAWEAVAEAKKQLNTGSKCPWRADRNRHCEPNSLYAPKPELPSAPPWLGTQTPVASQPAPPGSSPNGNGQLTDRSIRQHRRSNPDNLQSEIALTRPCTELRRTLTRWVLLLVGCWRWSPRGLRSREPTPTPNLGNPEGTSGSQMGCRSSQPRGKGEDHQQRREKERGRRKRERESKERNWRKQEKQGY